MNKEGEDFLRELFLGATLDDGEEIKGINFTSYHDGAVLMRFHTVKPFVANYSDSLTWHHLRIPAINIQMVQDRLASVPSTLSSLTIESSASDVKGDENA